MMQAAFDKDLNLIKVVWEVLEEKSESLPFKDVTIFVRAMNDDEIADFLLRVGFSIKRSIVLTEKGQSTEWETVIKTPDFPVLLAS